MKYILIPFLALYCSVVFGQDCSPISPITLPASQLSQSKLLRLVEEKRLAYTEVEVRQELSKIKRCNNQLGIQLRQIENDMSAYALRA